MRHVVVVAVVAVAVAVAATSIQVSRGQAASLEESRVQQGALLQRLDRLEQRLAAASGPQAVPAAVAPQPGVAVAPQAGPARPALVSASSPQHSLQLQTANAMVDRGIQGGQWSMNDMTELAAATQGLSTEERDRLMSRLTMAINSDQVKFDPRRVPGR